MYQAHQTNKISSVGPEKLLDAMDQVSENWISWSYPAPGILVIYARNKTDDLYPVQVEVYFIKPPFFIVPVDFYRSSKTGGQALYESLCESWSHPSKIISTRAGFSKESQYKKLLDDLVENGLRINFRPDIPSSYRDYLSSLDKDIRQRASDVLRGPVQYPYSNPSVEDANS